MQPSIVVDITDAEAFAYSICAVMAEVLRGKKEDMGLAKYTTLATVIGSDNDADVAHATAAERLASAAELTVNVSYQQMVVTLSQAPLQTLSDAIEVLQHAREQRGQEGA